MSIQQSMLYIVVGLLVLTLLTQQQTCTAGTLTISCDPRCNNLCTAINDQNACCDCVNSFAGVNHFLYSRASLSVSVRCAPTCPPTFYPNTDLVGLGTTYYQCSACHQWCQTCTAATNSDCVTCITTAYLTGTTLCTLYDLAYNIAQVKEYLKNNPCPLTYYGVYTTKKCEPCPLGCLECGILIQDIMPSPFSLSGLYQWDTPCPGDGLCKNALQCYACSTISYVLSQGKCFPKTRCLRYSLYNSTLSGFNPAFCYCIPGFYLNGYLSCQLCHYLCQTCSGPLQSDCIKCYTGATPVAGSCVGNDSYTLLDSVQDTLPAGPLLKIWTPSYYPERTACNGTYYIFGYYGYDPSTLNSLFTSASLEYQIFGSVFPDEPHYAIHFKATFLFIDDWPDGTLVVFNTSNNRVVYNYKYSMNEVVGEYLCGTAAHDHRVSVQFTFPHNVDDLLLIISTSRPGYQWGIRDILVGMLKCDPSCSSCTGPTEFDCLTCGANQVLVNGDCVCDSSNGYYNDTFLTTPACVTNCSANNYGNPITRTCTTDCPNSTYVFKYVSAAGVGTCVDYCPSDKKWKRYTDMTCVSACFSASEPVDSLNLYSFNGTDTVCYNQCPNGYYGDPQSGQCVSICPLTAATTDNANVSSYALGKFCVLACSASTYGYHLTRKCQTSCPTGFYKNNYLNASGNNICEDLCSVTMSGFYKLGSNATGRCVNSCPDGSYADLTLFLCVANCNGSAFKVVRNTGTGTLTTENLCQLQCPSTASNLYGNWDTGTCVLASACPLNTFGDKTTTFCESNCTDPTEYGDNITRLCQTSCSGSAFKQNYTKRCVVTCPISNYQGDPQFGDSIFQDNFCVRRCISKLVSSSLVHTFADAQNNRQCVYECRGSPVSTFGLVRETSGAYDNICVTNCSSTTWGDVRKNRTCTTVCSNYTLNGSNVASYGYNQTRLCVDKCPDTLFGLVPVADPNGAPVCVSTCQSRNADANVGEGMFGNPETNLCVDKCPQPYFGDPTGNRLCVRQCSSGYFAQKTDSSGSIIANRVCVATCNYGWADNKTRTCVLLPTQCESGLYAHQTNHKCVTPVQCQTVDPLFGFADPVTQKCVNRCFTNGSLTYYGDPATRMCVLVCPNDTNLFGDNNTNLCVTGCSQASEVRDPQFGRRCVTSCSRTPVPLYYDQLKDLCVARNNCTPTYYSDNSTTHCTQDCQSAANQYADPVTGQCVQQCSLNWYGYNRTQGAPGFNGICVLRCLFTPTLKLWADNLTVLCTSRCSPLTYGVDYTGVGGVEYGVCESTCPEGQFARDTDNLCVSDCGPDLWQDEATNKCVPFPQNCSDSKYGDNQTHACVDASACSIVLGVQYVADNVSRLCVPQCPPLDAPNNFYNWADMVKKLCVAKCPNNTFGYNDTRVCQTYCTPTDTTTWMTAQPYQFADPQLQVCVPICSHFPIPTFGQTSTFTCVQARYCPGETWAEIEINKRRCVAACPMASAGPPIVPQKYADNITKSCVTTCPTYFYGDIQRGYGMCVSVCPSTAESTPRLQFSDNSSKTCVTVCPSSPATFGDQISLTCVLTCPLTYFAQESPSRYCVRTCSANTWGNPIRRFCQVSRSSCPTVNGSRYYGDDDAKMCVKTCGDVGTTPNKWGENSTRRCQDSCTTGYKYTPTRVCIDLCPASLDGDGLFADQGMCYSLCQTANFYRQPLTRQCKSSCVNNATYRYYKDDTTWRCVVKCPRYPVYYYAYDVDGSCRTDCPGSTMRDPISRTCVSTCPSNTFLDPNSDTCVQQCPTENSTNGVDGMKFFGNTVPSIPICVVANDCPVSYYADMNVRLCVQVCSQNQWIYGKQCVSFCPDGYYGHPVSRVCVQPMSCPSNHYAENFTRTCVTRCNGTFALLSHKVCVSVCPTTFYADSFTRQCTQSCTNNASVSLSIDFTTQSCVSSCSASQFLYPDNNTCIDLCPDPYYQDPISRMCVTVCPSVPALFGDTNVNKCVQYCNASIGEFKNLLDRTCGTTCPDGYYRDNTTRMCVAFCQNSTYADTVSKYCVSNCTPRYSLDQPDLICTSTCPSPYFKDPTTFKCVLTCPTAPSQYFKISSNINNRRCDTGCPADEYRDFKTFACVAECPIGTYRDLYGGSGNCVTICPETPNDTYADSSTGSCVMRCPDGMFAENLTRTCVSRCPNKTDLYADNLLTIPRCVYLCSPNTYADPYKLTCESNCHNSPQTYRFGNSTTRICVATCPYPYVSDNNTLTCVQRCLTTAAPYLDKVAQRCVNVCTSDVYRFAYMPAGNATDGTCEQFCPGGTFAYLVNGTCVTRCPDGWYGDIQNNTCYTNCSLANDKFADPINNMCVATCPSVNGSYDSYADLFTRMCVPDCPVDKFTVKDTHTKRCEPSCTLDTQFIDYDLMMCVPTCAGGKFADPISQSCVGVCSLYTNRYGYDGICYTQCPAAPAGLYANPNNRLCVTALNCPSNMFGLDPERICIEVCPRNLYGQTSTRTCVLDCLATQFADPSTKLCVDRCPAVPSLYGKNKKCLPFCTGLDYADNQTRLCSPSCTTTPIETYADNSTNNCVEKCPNIPNYFSQNYTFTCTNPCPESQAMFADYSTRTCVKYCPRGDFPTFADPNSRQCVPVCPDLWFMQNSTGTCVQFCSQGFADNTTRYCIATCPNRYYGLFSPYRVCVPECPESTPQLYASDQLRMCNSSCSQFYETFMDDTSNRCVKICPIQHDLYADSNTRRCVGATGCIANWFSDFSTRTCVDECPMIPSLFGYAGQCMSHCPNGSNTWADAKTRKCVTLCPELPAQDETFGDNSTWTCVQACPTKPYTWADNISQTCVPVCPAPQDYYADNYTGKCQPSCTQGTFADSTTRRCVQTCPMGWFGRNATGRCVTGCQSGQFADHLLRLCVSRCSTDPIFYGNPDTNNCTEICPPGNYSFGNPLTQRCVKYLTNTTSGRSGCPDYYYSENNTRLCVKKCPAINDTYGDNSTWKCVSICPYTPISTFSDNSTMMCVSRCPEYPEYYAQNYSRRCVPLCLEANLTYTGSFANNITRECLQRCPANPDYYSDNSTRRCVFHCPARPLTFADNSTRRCVTTCPISPDIYGDLSTRRCVEMCPQNDSTYAEPTSRMCVKVCPSPLFGNNQTNRCVPYGGCPNGTYADNTTRLCVAICPEYPQTYGDSSTKRCVTRCPSSPDIYADPFSQTCVIRCPNGTYAENDTRRCMPDCPFEKVNYADNLTNRCVSRCPGSQQTYGDNSTKQCVRQCPDTPFTYADNITRHCLPICQNTTLGGYADNRTRVCVTQCPPESYGDILTRYCVSLCPPGYYSYNLTQMCVTTCPEPFFGDNTTWSCVSVCPTNHRLFGEVINRTCTDSCPDGTFADSYSQRCVQQCPGPLNGTADTFGYDVNKTCLHECPIPLYGYPVTRLCLPVCIDPYYENITDHLCYRCPDECAVCDYPQKCLVCVADHYLYAGSCLQSCPTFPVITFANPTGQCGTAFECTAGYFALNTTKSCVQNCPLGFYKNTTMQTCDSCLRGCSLCVNSAQCITCDSSISLWDAGTCHVFCSPLRRYYTSIGCVSTCPAGTYLQLVSCLTCSSICKTCIVQPQNCLTCANGFYLSNNLCVQKCPNNTKAVLENDKLYCKSCAQIDCTVTPLTYEITQYVEDYQYKFRFKFSEKVNITEQIDKVIRIRQKTVSRRRVLQVTYQYLDYTIIDYGNGEYVFILNNFDAREQANMQFSFEIINPEAIVSPSGQFPQQTRKTIVLQSSEFYAIADYSPHLANYCLVVAIVTVFLLVLTFWTNQSIWMPVIDFFHLLFALLFINVAYAPNLAYCLAQAKVVALTFLPNMFGGALPTPMYDVTITSTMFTVFGDIVFLRTMGFLYTVLLVLVIVCLLMLLLWKKGPKSIKKYCKNYLKDRLWKRDVHGFVSLFFLPTMIISFIKMKNYISSSAIEGFSIFSSWLFMVPMLAAPVYFAYKLYKLFKTHPSTIEMLKKAYEYITSRELILSQNPIYYFSNDKNEIDLKTLSQPIINQIKILPYPIETRFGNIEVTMPLLQYTYKLLVAFFLAVAFEKGTAQLFLLLLVSLLNLIYFAAVRPYIHIPHRQYNNYLMIHNMALFMLIVIAMIIVQLQANYLSYEARLLIGNIAAGLVVYAITINVSYFIFRTYHWYHDNIWRPFVESELFQQNYTLQYWDYKKQYEILDREKVGKTGNREQFLEAIKLENKLDGLQSMVRRDPNQSSISKTKKKQQARISLRPNRTQQLKKQITNMFQTFNDEKQKSAKSLRSSERLSKGERNRVREVIFGEKDLRADKDQYEEVKIEERSQQHREDSEQLQQEQTEYQYQYIDEEYPEGTDMQEILKNCKKGEIILP